MIDRQDPLPVSGQCRLLGLSRSGCYYTPRPVSERDLDLMRKIDEHHISHPSYGSRRIQDGLLDTGAMGLIGSELCRQITRRSPGRLILFEIAESPLFNFEMEMREKFPALGLVPVIGDIRDRVRVEEITSVIRRAMDAKIHYRVS